MRTDTARKQTLKVVTQQNQENTRNTRRTLKVIQQAANDKENLVGRSKLIEKGIKLASNSGDKPKQSSDKSVQTDEYEVKVAVTIEDLTSNNEPSEGYWKKLAEKRGQQLEESLIENERLKENIETLQEENRVCKEMLDEAKTLIEVLQEMVADDTDGA